MVQTALAEKCLKPLNRGEKPQKNQWQPKNGQPIDGGAHRQTEKKVFEELIQVPAVLGENVKEKYFMVRSSLGDEEKEKMVSFFRANIYVFAWQHTT